MIKIMQNITAAALLVVANSSLILADAEAAEQTAIRGLMQQWLRAYNAKDIDGLLSLYSDKIYFANNGNRIKQGPAAVRQHFSPQFTANTETTINFSEEIVAVSETLAHIGGKYRVNIPQADGDTAYAYGRVLLIFEKEDDQWKLIVDFDNTASDISAGDFDHD